MRGIDRDSKRVSSAIAGANRNFKFFQNTISLVKWPAYIAGAGGAAQALSALGAGAVGLTGALGPLTGALVALPAAFGAAGQGAGTALLAFSGLGDALGAMSDQQAKAGQSAIDTASQHRSAAEQVKGAEEALASAQRTVKVSQEDLTQARKDAVRELQDLKFAAEDAALGEKRAALSLSEARKNLEEVSKDPTASALDMKDALLGVDEAQQALKESKVENARAQKDSNEADRKGVQGNTGVVAARRSLADANRSVADALRGLKNAQLDANAALASGGAAADLLAQKMAKLSPAARSFAKFLFSLKPQLDKLRQAAGQNLFPGLEKGLRSAMKNFPILQRVVAQTGRVMGGLAAQAGKLVGSKAFGRDFATIGKGNARLLGNMGKAGLNLADAMRHIMVAAQPLIKWMGRLAVGWTKNIAGAAKTGRETGKLAHFFRQTREVMERLFSITGHLASAFLEIGKAAAPLGRSILAAFDKASGGLERWTKSISGQNALKKYFADARAPLFEMGRLIRDVVKAFFQLGASPGLTNLIRQVRTELLPVLVDVIDNTTRSLGPALVNLGVQFAKLFANFAGASGPLTTFVNTLTGILTLFNHLPGPVKSALVQVAAFGAIMKALSFSSAISGISNLISLYKRVPAAAAAATAATEASTAASGVGAVGGLGKAPAAAGVGGKLYGGLKAPGSTKAALGGIGSKIKMGAGFALAGVGGLIGITLATEAMNAFSKQFADPAKGLVARIEQLKGGSPGGIFGSIGHFFQGDSIIPHGKNSLIGLTETGDKATDLINILKKIPDASRKALPVMERQALALGEQLGLTSAQMGKLANSFAKPAQAIDNMRERIRKVREGFHDNLGSILSETQQNMARITTIFGEKSKQGQKLLASNYRGAVHAIKKSMHDGFISTEAGLAAITNLLKQQLQVWGVKGDALHKALNLHGKVDVKPGAYIPTGFQRGGAIVPGMGSGDKVPLHLAGRLAAYVEPGELVSVANRRATGALMAANAAVPRFAKGGKVNNNAIYNFMGSSPLAAAEASGLNKVSLQAHKFLMSHKPKGGGAVPVGHGVSMFTDPSGEKWPVATWIAKILVKAMKAGVNFSLSSGFRTFQEQTDIYNSGVRPAAVPGTSNHEGANFPRGAVDLDAGVDALNAWLLRSKWARTLIYAGAKDPVHFSHPHGGSYQRGGIIGRLASRVPGLQGGGFFSSKSSRKMNEEMISLAGGNFDASEAAALMHAIRGPKPGLMGAITVPESGGRYDVVNSIGATGLWQIYNHPDLVARFGDMRLPIPNAQAAAVLFNDGGEAPWLASAGKYASTAAINAALAPKMRGVITGKVATASNAPKPPTKAEKRKKRHDAFKKRLQKAIANAAKIDLDPRTKSRVTNLTASADQFEEWAQAASAIGTDTSLGVYRGQTELQLLQQELDKLLAVRNVLVLAYSVMEATRQKLIKQIAAMHDELKRLQDIPAKNRTKNQKDKIGSLRVGIAGARQSLRGLNTTLGQDSMDAEGLLGTIASFQGSGGPFNEIPSLSFGQVGGRILDVQVAMREAGGAANATDSESADLLRQLLNQERQKTAALTAQVPVFKSIADFPPFGGSFAAGGTVPGPIGAPRTIVAHGGETVTPPSGGGDTYLLVEDGAVDANRIRVISRDEYDRRSKRAVSIAKRSVAARG